VKDFEMLLQDNMLPLQRYVNYKIANSYDAEDVLQDVCLAAMVKFETLKNISAFKAWLLSIANNKIKDYYRKKAKALQIPIESVSESALVVGRMGITEQSVVSDTLELLGNKEQQMLYLYYFKNLTQEDIARQLSVPLGTVKSRLHYAKQKFRQNYPNTITCKGEENMIKIPDILPEYKIAETDLAPFSVVCKELQGWPIIPRVGENCTWGIYDMPSRKRTEYTEMKVVGKAQIHGIEGVEISAIQYSEENRSRIASVNKKERRFVAQLTDTHCRYLAESHYENGVQKLYTFLDGDEFVNNWGFGEDNCGKEIIVYAKGLLSRNGNIVEGCTDKEVVDVVGRFEITINDKIYDTVCVMDIQSFNDGIASEEYFDKNGRLILWRRFNKNDWAYERYGKLWTEMLPDNERLIINGETYVHWYDCVTDYIF